jgi:hypothetical protein
MPGTSGHATSTNERRSRIERMGAPSRRVAHPPHVDRRTLKDFTEVETAMPIPYLNALSGFARIGLPPGR